MVSKDEELKHEEALRLKAKAESKYKCSDFKSALKYLNRALTLWPENDALTSMATAFEILFAASKSPASPDWYEILRSEPFSNVNAIKKQYRKLALALHPDKNPYPGSEEAFKLVNLGFRCLSDKIRRKDYDLELRMRIQDEKMKEVVDDSFPVSVRGIPFWTACSTCKVLHQFDRMYLGHILVCSNCRKSFEALEIGSGTVSDDDGSLKIAELKKTKKKKKNEASKEEITGGNGRLLRSCGPKRRTSSVGEILERSDEPKKVKIDDETMTLAEFFQSRVNLKSQKETKKKREKEKEKEKEKEREEETVEFTTGKRDSKTEKRSRDGDLEVMAVEDSDFYDFDKDRVERSFKQGQVWAIYDDDDGMPRHYGLIEELVSVNPFEVKISWLDLQSNNNDDDKESIIIGIGKTGFRVSCGRFKVSRRTSSDLVNIFSHQVDCERAAKEAYRIYPKKGSVWALYKRDDESNTKRCYDIVVFLTSYSEIHGLSMAFLDKVDGFKTIFKRREIGSHAIRWLERDDVGLFSHQIPARKLCGDEAPGLPTDCWELDPASLPANLLRIRCDNEVLVS